MPTTTEHSSPIRTCVGCRERRTQAELIRCVLGPDGLAHVSRVAPGRGAWLCGAACLDLAVSRSGFERAWRTKLHGTALAVLATEIAEM